MLLGWTWPMNERIMYFFDLNLKYWLQLFRREEQEQSEGWATREFSKEVEHAFGQTLFEWEMQA